MHREGISWRDLRFAAGSASWEASWKRRPRRRPSTGTDLPPHGRFPPMAAVSDTPSQTLTLLRRWHGGDREALGELVARDLPWIRAHVERRPQPELRRHLDADDLVQDAM